MKSQNYFSFITICMLWQSAVHSQAPIAVVPKMNNIMIQHQEVTQKQSQGTEPLHMYYFKLGLEQMPNDVQAAINSFRESLRFLPENAPAMLELAKLLYCTEDDYFNAMVLVERTWQLPDIDSQTRKELQKFSQQMAVDLHDLALDYENAGIYPRALVVWTNLNDFCAVVEISDCGSGAKDGIMRAHLGFYNNFIRKANQALSRGDLEQAEREIRRAMGYQKLRSDYILSAHKAKTVLQHIKIKQHSQLIEQGREYLKGQSFGNALKSFEDALGIEQDFPVFRYKELPDLIKQSKRPLLMADFDRLRIALELNEMELARSILLTLDEDVCAYDFMSDQKIILLLDEYHQNLHGEQ